MKFSEDDKLFFRISSPILAAYLFLIWRPIENLISGFLVDDSFYYFKPASNLVRGLGPTFDGENLANGYHPLWMGINYVIYYFASPDKILPIHISLALALLFFFGSAFFCWKIISKFVSDRSVKIVLLLAYLLNPWNISNSLNGLETSLAIFLITLLFWIFLEILDGKNSIINFFWLGVVGGLVVLARLDHGLFLAAIFIYFIFSRKFSWQSILAFFLPAFLMAAPWFFYNYLYFGSPIPASGLSYTMINYRLWFYKDRSLLQIVLWSLYNLVGTVAFTLKTIGIPSYFSGFHLWKSFFSLSAALLLVITIPLYFYFKKKEEFIAYFSGILSSTARSAILTFFAAYFGLVIVHGAIRWSAREWYFASFPFLVIISAALFLGRINWSSRRRAVLMFFAVLLSLSYLVAWKKVPTQYGSQLEMYGAAIWARDNLSPDARIASFNSGIIGYFSDRFVMNSDGLINNSAFEAMKINRLWELFENEGIDYIIDYEITLYYRFKTFFGIEDPMKKVRRVSLPDTIERSFEGYGGSREGIFEIIYE